MGDGWFWWWDLEQKVWLQEKGENKRGYNLRSCSSRVEFVMVDFYRRVMAGANFEKIGAMYWEGRAQFKLRNQI